MNIRTSISLVLLLTTSMSASAELFTFDISTKLNYVGSGDGPLFGNAGSLATIAITVDNGGLTDVNQTYKFSQITNISVSTTGTFTLNDTIASNLPTYSGLSSSTALLLTGATGTGTVQFNGQSGQSVLFTDNSNNLNTLLISENNQVYLQSSNPSYAMAEIYNTNGGNLVLTAVPASVPIPPAFWLFGAALAGCIYLGKRQYSAKPYLAA